MYRHLLGNYVILYYFPLISGCNKDNRQNETRRREFKKNIPRDTNNDKASSSTHNKTVSGKYGNQFVVWLGFAYCKHDSWRTFLLVCTNDVCK